MTKDIKWFLATLALLLAVLDPIQCKFPFFSCHPQGAVNVTDDYYGRYIVDSHDQVIGDKPWLLFFSRDDSKFCDTTVHVLENLAEKFDKQVNFGIVNCDDSETEGIRKTLGVPRFPHFKLLNQEHQFDFKGEATLDKLKDFLMKDFREERHKKLIPKKMGRLAKLFHEAEDTVTSSGNFMFRRLKNFYDIVWVPQQLHDYGHYIKLFVVWTFSAGALALLTAVTFIFFKPKDAFYKLKKNMRQVQKEAAQEIRNLQSPPNKDKIQ